MSYRQDKIDRQLEMVSKPIAMPSLDVHLTVKLPCINQVLDCLENKQGFGLQSTEGTVIFDTKNLQVYELHAGELTKTNCRDEKDFMNYLKLAAQNHTTFISEKTCISLVSRKNISESKKVLKS
jgi:hypothetical protein